MLQFLLPVATVAKIGKLKNHVWPCVSESRISEKGKEYNQWCSQEEGTDLSSLFLKNPNLKYA